MKIKQIGGNKLKEDKRTSKVKIYGDEFFAENGKDIKEILKDLIKREAQNVRISKPAA